MQKYKSLTGMNDILPHEVPHWQKMEATARNIFENYGYREIRLPVMEPTGLFVRGIGEDNLVVQKEMYSFKDKGGDSVTLRPEGTAGVVRAYIENSLFATDPVTKLYYLGPMFRYERPQKGRLRQFHQIGAELIGVDSAWADAELVIMLDRWIKALGISDYRIQVNSIGRLEERQDYIKSLVAYFSKYRNDLSQEDQRRLQTNPLRLFDSKDESCRKLLKAAPKILDALSSETRRQFEDFQTYLTEAAVAFEVNPYIVRGLDYYEKTAFEFVSPALGAQDAFAGGGRYNHLIKELGGGDVPATGFAIGCERVVLLLEALKPERSVALPNQGVYFIPMTEPCFAQCRALLQTIRDHGLKSEMDYQVKSLKSQMRRANKLHFKYVAIVGEDELTQKVVTLKDLESGDQKKIPFGELLGFVSMRR